MKVADLHKQRTLCEKGYTHLNEIRGLEQLAANVKKGRTCYLKTDKPLSFSGPATWANCGIPLKVIRPAILDWITVEIQKHKDSLAKL
jgi:hypothetical protein